MRYCPKCGTMVSDDSQQFCNACGTSLGAPVQNTYDNLNGNPSSSLPMGWYEVLIVWGLYVFAGLTAVMGITHLAGSRYSSLAGYVYAAFDGLQLVDILYGLVHFAIAAFAIYVRTRMAQYCADGPLMLKRLFAASLIAGVVYLLACSIVGFGLSLSITVFIEIITAGIAVGANHVYFEKRKSMFVN